ncbi:hypothetical protein ABZ865_20200 [Streptomyces sp. NPDC047085]|jgi:hypothetical protein|uniref:hypothetical protein n=1 Tax=Streptomyces sp. NPDC047085 TaxID=3155140 RepID=UPI0033C129C0
MADHVSTFQLIGVAVLAVAAVVWTVVFLRLVRRVRVETAGWRPAWRPSAALRILPALPAQARLGPSLEAVELTPAEQDAFAVLVRQLGGR